MTSPADLPAEDLVMPVHCFTTGTCAVCGEDLNRKGRIGSPPLDTLISPTREEYAAHVAGHSTDEITGALMALEARLLASQSESEQLNAIVERSIAAQ